MAEHGAALVAIKAADEHLAIVVAFEVVLLAVVAVHFVAFELAWNSASEAPEVALAEAVAASTVSGGQAAFVAAATRCADSSQGAFADNAVVAAFADVVVACVASADAGLAAGLANVAGLPPVAHFEMLRAAAFYPNPLSIV